MKKQLAVYLDQLAGEVERVDLDALPKTFHLESMVINSASDEANAQKLFRAAENLGANVRLLPHDKMPENTAGRTNPEGIILDKNLTSGGMLGTLAHELAHWVLHTPTKKEVETGTGKARDIFGYMMLKLTGGTEVEAEAVSYVVLAALGARRGPAPTLIANAPARQQETARELRKGGVFHDRVIDASATILKAAHVDISNVAA